MLSHETLLIPNLHPSLDGLRLAHLSDTHFGRGRKRLSRILRAVHGLDVDIIIFTGDYMNRPGDETVTVECLSTLCAAMRAKLATVGVFGNHDTWPFRHAAQTLPIRWLCDASCRIEHLPLEILGVEAGAASLGDSLALLNHLSKKNGKHHRPGHYPAHAVMRGHKPQRGLRIMLSHFPMYLPTASDLGVDVVFSGHTHGGQCRLPTGRAIVNSSDLPIKLTAGLLRHRGTLCAISRGLGESVLPIRMFCPPHIPIYTLGRGPMEGIGGDHLENVRPW